MSGENDNRLSQRDIFFPSLYPRWKSGQSVHCGEVWMGQTGHWKQRGDLANQDRREKTTLHSQQLCMTSHLFKLALGEKRCQRETVTISFIWLRIFAGRRLLSFCCPLTPDSRLTCRKSSSGAQAVDMAESESWALNCFSLSEKSIRIFFCDCEISGNRSRISRRISSLSIH